VEKLTIYKGGIDFSSLKIWKKIIVVAPQKEK
jgi:hypothetical protein